MNVLQTITSSDSTVTIDTQVVTPLTNTGYRNHGYLITMEPTVILILTTLEMIHRNHTDRAVIETRKP